jgi:hypothetical protein
MMRLCRALLAFDVLVLDCFAIARLPPWLAVDLTRHQSAAQILLLFSGAGPLFF